MEKQTKNEYLRKRFVRLLDESIAQLANQEFDILTVVEKEELSIGTTGLNNAYQSSSIQSDVRLVVNSVRNQLVSFKSGTQLLDMSLNDSSIPRRNSRFIARRIIENVQKQLLENEDAEAVKEHRREWFSISWVTPEMRKERRLKRRMQLNPKY